MNVEIIDSATILGKEFTVYRRTDDRLTITPLFSANEICEWIDWRRSVDGGHNIVTLLDMVDEKDKINIKEDGKNKWYITENGLYDILFLSNEPIAKAFKKEAKDYLIALRLHGVVRTTIKSNEVIEFVFNMKTRAQKPKPSEITVYTDEHGVTHLFCSMFGKETICGIDVSDIVHKGKVKQITCSDCKEIFERIKGLV